MAKTRRQISVQLTRGPSIAGIDLPQPIVDFLKQKLSDFSIAETHENLSQVDILLQAADKLLEKVPASGKQMVALYGFWVTQQKKLTTVYFFWKGKAIVSITFAEQIVIQFINHKKMLGFLNKALMFCLRVAFNRQDKLVIHGAAFSKGEQSFLLLGPRGIGKTKISLSLLKNNWNYIADDKFILQEGTVTRLQNKLLLRDYHFTAHAWLASRVNNIEKWLYWSGVRKFLRTVIQHIVPEKLLPNEDRLLNKGVQCSVDQLFPLQTSVNCIQPNAIILLDSGSALTCQQISQGEMITKFEILQKLADAEFNALENFLVLKNAIKPFISKNTLSKHFPDALYFEQAVPTKIKSATLCKRIIERLQP